MDGGTGGLALAICAPAVALALWAGQAGAQSSSELFDYPRTALNGTVSAQASIPEDTCRQLCSTRSGCAGFDHSSAGTCRLFVSVEGAQESVQHTAGTRALLPDYRPPTNPPAAVTPLETEQPEPPEIGTPTASFRRFRNQDLSNEAAETRAAGSTDACETMCREGVGWCVAYTFDAWNRKCFLKDGVGQLEINARATSGILSSLGAPGFSGEEIRFERFNGKAFPGNGFMVRSAGNRDACENECWGTDQCIAYSFTRAQRQCVLYEYSGEYLSRQGTDSGAKRQD